MAALVKTAFPVSERMRELLNNHNIYVIRASSERMALGPRKRHGQFDDRPPSYRSLVGVLLPDKMYPELEGEDEEAEIARRDVIKLQGDIAEKCVDLVKKVHGVYVNLRLECSFHFLKHEYVSLQYDVPPSIGDVPDRTWKSKKETPRERLEELLGYITSELDTLQESERIILSTIKYIAFSKIWIPDEIRKGDKLSTPDIYFENPNPGAFRAYIQINYHKVNPEILRRTETEDPVQPTQFAALKILLPSLMDYYYGTDRHMRGVNKAFFKLERNRWGSYMASYLA